MERGDVGFRIVNNIDRTPVELVEKFREVSTAQISDVMSRFGAMDSEIKPLCRGLKMVGTAFTVKVNPGDNLMLHKAILMAEKGDIIAVDGGGYCNRALAGEFMCARAKFRGIAGLIIDGSIRDVAGIRRLSYSVYARGVIPVGPFKEGPGEINVPISCGGIPVMPGDIVIGDDDGVVVVPSSEAPIIAQKAEVKQGQEKEKRKSIERGEVVYEWVDRVLKEKGVW
jgi:RraA family protein